MLTDNDREEVTFTIKCTMRRRWAEQFLSMLKYMQKLGSWGSSREVAIYSDGDGDFRPKFEFDPMLLPKEKEPRKDEHGDRLYDAG